MKKVLSLLILFALLICVCCAACANAPFKQESTESYPLPDDIKFTYALYDWPSYTSFQALSDVATDIYEGKVTNIFFDILDGSTGKSVKNKKVTDTAHLWLNTVYEIEVATSYKGAKTSKMYICVDTGLEDYQVAEQYNLLMSAGIYREEFGIQVMLGFEPLELGETYLFFTAERGGDYQYIVNPDQFAYNATDRKGKVGFEYADIKAFVEQNYTE